MTKTSLKQPPKKWSEMTPKEKKKAKINAVGLGILIFCILIGVMITSDDAAKKQELKPSKEIVFNSEWDGSVKQIEDYLKTNLNDPDSYKAVEWSNVNKTAKGEFVVRHKYRAKNSFGGVVTQEQIFTLDSLGRVVNILNFD